MKKTLLAAAMAASAAAPAAIAAEDPALPFAIEEIATLDEPWALALLPDGRLLASEKKGALRVVGADGALGTVTGVPKVDYGGQGGFGDVVLHPGYAENGWVYLSYAEAGEDGTRGAAVARAKLALDDDGGGALSGLEVVWRQWPKKDGRGHYGHRIAFGEGKLWISSGDRQEFTPAQDMQQNLGKILRLEDDGKVPADNPFADQDGVAREVWSLGHRNPLGIAFAPDGRLWENEMGPSGGDELNRIERGSNYGYPVVSNGDHYDGRDIPDHPTRPEFNAPEITWTPVISPSSMIFYTGDAFADWKGDALIGALSGQAIVRVEIDGDSAREAARYPMQNRIRELEQAPDGALYVLEDETRGKGGRLLKLTPKR